MKKRLTERSVAGVAALERRLPNIVAGWVMLASLICGLRLGWATSGPTAMQPEMTTGFLSYALVIATPVIMLALSLRWFSAPQPQPTFRLARLGSWRVISAREAKAHSLYGPYGFMFSLLVGILLNIPVRTIEFLSAIPPLPNIQPFWLKLLTGLTLADVVIFSAFYAICFVAALRCHPLFPRLLLFVWIFDLTTQWSIQFVIHAVPHMPEAVADAASNLFTGNIKKVLISIVLWLPYLLLSKRVNVTYRHRVKAD